MCKNKYRPCHPRIQSKQLHFTMDYGWFGHGSRNTAHSVGINKNAWYIDDTDRYDWMKDGNM